MCVEVGPLVSLTRPCPSSHWSGFWLLEKAVSGECRVLEAPGHKGARSPAQQLLHGTRVPGFVCLRHGVCLWSLGDRELCGHSGFTRDWLSSEAVVLLAPQGSPASEEPWAGG